MPHIIHQNFLHFNFSLKEIKNIKFWFQIIQVDFDDGHCPTWRNQLIGWYNIYKVAHNLQLVSTDRQLSADQHPFKDQQVLSDQQVLNRSPILMLRPRAWNMTDHCVMVDGKKVSGALLDFAILMFHNGKIMANSGDTFDERSSWFSSLSKAERCLNI